MGFTIVAALAGAALHEGSQQGNLDRVEALWCFLAYFGALIHFRGLREAVRDQQGLREKVNGRLRIAQGRIREEAGRMTKQLGFLFVGCIVANLPNSNRTFASMVIRFVFIGAELLMIYLSIHAQYDDHVLIRENQGGSHAGP